MPTIRGSVEGLGEGGTTEVEAWDHVRPGEKRVAWAKVSADDATFSLVVDERLSPTWLYFVVLVDGVVQTTTEQRVVWVETMREDETVTIAIEAVSPVPAPIELLSLASLSKHEAELLDRMKGVRGAGKLLALDPVRLMSELGVKVGGELAKDFSERVGEAPSADAAYAAIRRSRHEQRVAWTVTYLVGP